MGASRAMDSKRRRLNVAVKTEFGQSQESILPNFFFPVKRFEDLGKT